MISIIVGALEIIVSLKFLSAAFTHAFRQDKATFQFGIQKMGAKSKPILIVVSVLLTVVAVLLAIDAIQLFLPTSLGWDMMIPIYSAALGVLLMIGSIVFHLKFREKPKVWISVIMLVLLLAIFFGFFSILAIVSLILNDLYKIYPNF